MSSNSSPNPYPRPDFSRVDQRWTSLDGPWDFLFDDEDIGLSQGWQRHGFQSQGMVPVAEPPLANTHQPRKIMVPFVFQSPASGIHEKGVHEVLWYERSIVDPRTSGDTSKGDRVLLRFGAVDYEATVWVSGHYVGGHQGGHVSWDLDITAALETSDSSNSAGAKLSKVTIRVYDSAHNLAQPRGKQYWGAQPEGIFYTPSSGIWQSVWLEAVPCARIADSRNGTIMRSNDIDSGHLHACIAVLGRRVGQECSIELEASIGGVNVSKSEKKRLPSETDRVTLDLNLCLSQQHRQKLPASLLQEAPLSNGRCWRNGLALWSPEYPLLYALTVRLFDSSGKTLDVVKTTTGMRSLNWTSGDRTFRLNGKPYFQALVLDQGYWSETLMTPPSPGALKVDIQLAKNMGFNGCRKHQKVEDPIFLYWADRLGFIVWGEMANAYAFSNDYVESFDQEWMEAVKMGINHPCIFTWTPVNESWGYPSLKDNAEQRNHIRSLYFMTKHVHVSLRFSPSFPTLDPTRSINENCGWEHVCQDLITFHDYSDGPELEKTCNSMQGILSAKSGHPVFLGPISHDDSGSSPRAGAPVLCTEFGGVNIAPLKDTVAGERGWGYTTASDPQDLLKRVERLIMAVVKGGHCCGFVYTQLTDIEQEVNGLYSIDRKEKLDSKRMRVVIDAARHTYYSQHS